MPNIAKIVCGTRGGVGCGGAIKTSIRFTLTPGSPNAELTLTMGNFSQSMPPQDMKLTVPENDAALCSTLCAVSALEPYENESDAYYSEILLDDGSSYCVRYSQLNVLISALWRSCSGCGFSYTPAPAKPAPDPPANSDGYFQAERSISMPRIVKIVCGTRGEVGYGGAISPGIIFTLISGSPNAELSLAVDYPCSIQSLFMPQDKKLIVPENDAELCSTLSAVSALEPCADKSEINLYYSEITLDDGTSYRVPYSQLNVLISALWRSCSERGFSSTPAPEPAPQPPAGSWKCPTCGAQRQNGKFCTECGLPKPADSENP